MSQVFLGSVGIANAYRRINGQPVHFFTAKTLTDSSINLSVSAEEVRGGPGGQLLGQFFHTSTFGLSMTDAVFKLEYIAAQVGADIINGGYGLVDENDKVVATGGVITLSELPIPLLENTDPLVWYNVAGSTEYASVVPTIDAESGTASITIPGADVIGNDVKYCVHYFANKEAARKVIVNSNFVPEELTVFLTTRLYAGDASAPETGKPVGTVTVKIPRFQLNGTADIALAMTSTATVQLQGNALSYDDGCEGGKYAEIVEVLQTSQFDGYTAIVAAADSLAVGDVPMVYLVGAKKTPRLLNNADEALTFTPALENGKIKTTLTKIEYNPKVNGLAVYDAPLAFTPTAG